MQQHPGQPYDAAAIVERRNARHRQLVEQRVPSFTYCFILAIVIGWSLWWINAHAFGAAREIAVAVAVAWIIYRIEQIYMFNLPVDATPLPQDQGEQNTEEV